MSDAAIAKASILGPRKLAALDRVDQLPREMRECVHDFGLPIVEVLTRHGIREARHIREIVREIWLGPRQEGQRNGAMNIVDFILSRGPTNSKTLRRALADNNFVIVPTHPTRAMLDASMAEVSGHNVRVTREEKHRRRLMAAIRAALSEDMK